MGIFLDTQGQLTPQSVVGSGRFQTPPSSHAYHYYLQVWKGSDEKQSRKRSNTVFSIIPLIRKDGDDVINTVTCALTGTVNKRT